MSREDRKNEQIMRMIERAEKQRQKREEKKIKAVSKPFRTLLRWMSVFIKKYRLGHETMSAEAWPAYHGVHVYNSTPSIFLQALLPDKKEKTPIFFFS